MRFIYVDEAGISAQEPVSVVAGVIIHADSKFVEAEAAIDALLDAHVPDKLRDGFIFHSTKLYSGASKIEPAIWRDGARWSLLEGFVALPRLLGLPVAVGMCRRGNAPRFEQHTLEQCDHAEALRWCLAGADYYLRQYTPAYEIGSMVLEDAGKNRKLLDLIPELMRQYPMTVPHEELLSNGITGVSTGSRGCGEIMLKRIRDGIYWQNKRQASFLQLADAWAFAWRLYLSSSKPDGERLMQAAFNGRPPPRTAFPGDRGGNNYMWSATG